MSTIFSSPQSEACRLWRTLVSSAARLQAVAIARAVAGGTTTADEKAAAIASLDATAAQFTLMTTREQAAYQGANVRYQGDLIAVTDAPDP